MTNHVGATGVEDFAMGTRCPRTESENLGVTTLTLGDIGS